MKFTAAAFMLLALSRHSVVNGHLRDSPSLRGGQEESSSSQQLSSEFPARGHQRERRLEPGGYIVLFEDSVEDVEDFAVELSNTLGKQRPAYIMKNTIHAAYMNGLSDADVEFLLSAEGVAFIEQNHFMDLFEGVEHQDQGQDIQQEEDDEFRAKRLAYDDERVERQIRRNQAIPNRQPIPWNIQMVNGPIQYTGTNKAWILDTGIMLNHPDLNVDRVNAFNVFTGTNAANDEHGHGTQVAGIIAAIDNAIGVVGVAAGATVVPIKVVDSNLKSTAATLMAGVDYVASKAKKGDVANISIGSAPDSLLDEAVVALAAKGVIVTIASGNSYMDAEDTSPARVNRKNVYTISSMNQSGRFSGFSNYGSVVDYACPGEGLKSTHINGGITSGDIFGTSFAAPHAAGVFLLGKTTTNGLVAYDPDGKPDPILVHDPILIHRG
jgi:Subtilase family